MVTPNLSAVWVCSPSEAWAAGDAGTVLKWDGHAWHPVCLASKRRNLHTLWGCPEDGVWVGGRRTLLQWPGSGGGGTITHGCESVTAIWGSGPDDIWFLAPGRLVLHWNGTGCTAYALPGEEDTEYYCLGGSGPDDPVWIAGSCGFLLRGDGRRWEVIDAETSAAISGVLPLGEDDLWLTTDAGQLRHWDGRRWTTAAFSAFGWLSGLCHVDGVIWACGARGVILQHQPDDGGTKD